MFWSSSFRLNKNVPIMLGYIGDNPVYTLRTAMFNLYFSLCANYKFSNCDLLMHQCMIQIVLCERFPAYYRVKILNM